MAKDSAVVGRLQPLQHYGPVTCLKICSDYIIAGYGPVLKVFEVQGYSIHLLYSRQVFKANKIHCIAVTGKGSDISIGVAGSRSFAVVPWSDVRADAVPVEHAINEWITSIAFADTRTLLILDSHNSVYRVNVSSFPYTKEPKINCAEKSLLYSGSIRVLDNGQILVAAGTVLHGIIIWDLGTTQIVHRLTAHEGSIFGVAIDATAHYIVSCSDDRSIKLYDYSNGSVLATGWGHGSRIWSLAFFAGSLSAPRIMSVGEDGSARIWQYHQGHQTLEQVCHWDTCHLGKHVWSGDVENEHLKLCVTGGADGRIRVHDLTATDDFRRYTLADFAAQGIQWQPKESIKQFYEVPLRGVIIMVTSHGQIMQLNECSGQVTRINLPEADQLKLKGFSVMKGFPLCDAVVIGARNGDLLVMSWDSPSPDPSYFWVLDDVLGHNKVTNILVHSQDHKFYVLTDSPNPAVPFVLRVFAKKDHGLCLDRVLKLAQPCQTSFTTTRMSIDPANDWLVLSSRYATLAVYKLADTMDIVPMLSIHKKIVAGDSITACELVSSRIGETCYLLTVRDGAYTYVTIRDVNGSMELSVNHQNKLARGFIEGAYLDHSGDVILYGFKSSVFYVWNETRQLEVASETCGGAHREWSLFRNTGSDRKLKLVYMSKSDMCVKTFNSRFLDLHYGLINSGTHGREIRSVAISPFEWSQPGRLIATAAEDTTVRLGLLSSSGHIESFWSMNNHVSGLQRVGFLDAEYLASCAANEEFYIWKISQLLGSRNPVVVEYARLAPLCADNPDLRIMDFATKPIENGFLVCTVYSDSAIKLWRFNVAHKTFHLLSSGVYTSCCILNVDFLELEHKLWLQISTTDGFLSMWDISHAAVSANDIADAAELGPMCIKQQLHQNGVKAVLNIPCENKYLVITGGDDNALILSVVSCTAGDLAFETKLFIQGAASATITSISQGTNQTVIVTSVDQVVRVWSYAGLALECISLQYTTVADTGCSDSCVIDGTLVVAVGGAGLSTFQQL